MAANLHVLVSSNVPPGIRGALNQWYIEVLPGIYVARVSARIRDHVWSLVVTALAPIEGSYAASIYQTPESEQGFRMVTIGSHDYEIQDFGGLQLVARHHNKRPAADTGAEFEVDW